MSKAMSKNHIHIQGANQNNLKNVSVDLEYGKLTVVTGVSGSGKSSLVFDTLYAEGQRRYVETFSPYVRQFMDRMDRPKVDRIDGVPPAIAIDQTNPVRTSRSTVGTMTELNDHLKMLFAQAAQLYCGKCGREVSADSPQSAFEKFQKSSEKLPEDTRYFVGFHVEVPPAFPVDKAIEALNAEGFTRVKALPMAKDGYTFLEIIADRFKNNVDPVRAIEAFEVSFSKGRGEMFVRAENKEGEILENLSFSNKLACPYCHINFSLPHESTFSFNSPLGACTTCNGFGRIMGIDYGLVIPDRKLSIREGAVRPWQTKAYYDCQKDMMLCAEKDGIPVDVPFEELSQKDQNWVLYGDPKWKSWQSKRWYGVKNFFDWLETKNYKMHVRVLLSRYRNYVECPDCHGARLKPQSLLWRVGTKENADSVLPPEQRFRPAEMTCSDETLQNLPGLNIYDLMCLPLEKLQVFFRVLVLPSTLHEGCQMVLDEISTRLQYLNEVGLGYLCLDRQSRTLSGGEVQRINMTTALGTSLVNTLFILDEPSIGLHPMDMDRVNAVMRHLRSAGNTLVVVEHDPQVMLSADRILDMGPGPGERGGKIIFDGTPKELSQSNTLTGKYLRGALKVSPPVKKLKIKPEYPAVVLQGVRANNLKDIDVRIPLNALVCVCGVSGSGKSTLIQNVLVPALLKAKGQSTEEPGEFDKILGTENILEVVFVDQSPIGKTTRSNPAIFSGAFSTIRNIFAATYEARSRGYTSGTFSFNQAEGRCPACEGSGYEHVEMQFLSDVYLTCPECGGKRYRPEILEVKITRDNKQYSIADILDLTVREALDLFENNSEIKAALEPLAEIGLDYLKLGQPIPTLSGGESQRLKLAKYVVDNTGIRRNKSLFRKSGAHPPTKLFVFDEPTTGLHFSDIAKLMVAFRKLIDKGHSVVLVEHNLDVINASDWLIELGPGAGDKGGQEIFAGPPSKIVLRETPTGQALNAYQKAIAKNEIPEFLTDAVILKEEPAKQELRSREANAIVVVNAREHNLKNLSVEIPRNSFTVLTGVSGSGKSTLAFDLVFNEGQRRYLESLNAYARSMVQPAARPDVDAIYGIPPTVAISQRVTRGGQKSTVATMTEVYHFMRLLFVKLGIMYCPNCRIPMEPKPFDEIAGNIITKYMNRKIMIIAPLIMNHKGIYRDLFVWALSRGFNSLIIDGKTVSIINLPELDRYKEHTIYLPVREFELKKDSEELARNVIQRALDYGKGLIFVRCDGNDEAYSTNNTCPGCGASYPELDPRLFSYNSKLGWCPTCKGNGIFLFEDAIEKDNLIDEAKTESPKFTFVCSDCEGTRLNPIARNVLYHGKSITDIAEMTIEKAEEFFKGLKLEGRESLIASDIVSEILSRLSFLQEVGLSYLNLDRSAPTLSGGESQRIRLASQLGTNLQGVCYVLDEPTIGLHPRDNKMLLSALDKLRSKGNSLLVVEHDEDTIRKADYLIDIGPGAGIRGGQIVAQGSAEDLMNCPASVTGRYLKEPLHHSGKSPNKTTSTNPAVVIKGAYLNNLQIKSVRFPLNRLTVVTGVSGSGKSTLARSVLLNYLDHMVNERGEDIFGCDAIEGWEEVKRVLEVDQTPIGKTPRSCPATYVGFYDAIRKLFAETNDAKERGFNASRFSFNVKEGRCPDCEGQGVQTIEMSFLPDVKVNCETCGTLRFNDQTLQVKWKGKNIGEVLQMEVDEAVEFFASQPSILHPLKLMQDVGLGYLTLGQPSPTLSGGEAQRIKLVTELTKVKDDITKRGRRSPHTFYVLDEPTVGLHMSDVDRLIKVLHRLVAAGNTVVVIEHNLDMMAEADWIVDLGPEGGAHGGKLVYEGNLQRFLKKDTLTAKALQEFLKKEKVSDL